MKPQIELERLYNEERTELNKQNIYYEDFYGPKTSKKPLKKKEKEVKFAPKIEEKTQFKLPKDQRVINELGAYAKTRRVEMLEKQLGKKSQYGLEEIYEKDYEEKLGISKEDKMSLFT